MGSGKVADKGNNSSMNNAAIVTQECLPNMNATLP